MLRTTGVKLAADGWQLTQCAGSGSIASRSSSAGRMPRRSKTSRWPKTTCTTIFPAFPSCRPRLIVEGLAQTGGILLGERHQFEHVVILAKIPRMTFHGWACPGDTLTYTAKLIDAREEGGLVECQAKIGERLVAEGEIFFAHVDDAAAGTIDQKNFVFSMRLLGVMDVGKPVKLPRRPAQ